MKKVTTILICMLCVLQLYAQIDDKRQLKKLFNEAEHCYLIDDYQQLNACIKQYADVLKHALLSLGDSADIYQAYYFKMQGAYYYGLADNNIYDYFSEMMYRKSLGVFEAKTINKSIEGMHANVVSLHKELAQLYYKQKMYRKALEQLDTLEVYYDNKLDIDIEIPNYYLVRSQQAICNARLGNFELALHQIEEAINDYYKKHKDGSYYEALRKRGKILMLQADSQGSTHYKHAIDSYQQYINERYASIEKEMDGMSDSQRGQYWLATHQFLYDCFRLGNRAPGMLYDLTLFSKDYLIRKKTTRIKWQQVKKALDKNGCAIEFVQYFGKNEEKRLGCMIIKHNSKQPLFIDLFSSDSVLNLSLTNSQTIGSAISSSSSMMKDTLYNDPRLSEMIWTKALMSAIGNAQKVYFAPDGLLHQLAIEYLMPDTTKVCHRLTSTRILTQKHRIPKTESTLLCGGISYDVSIQPYERGNDVVAYRFLSQQATNIKYLQWSKQEVDSIYAFRNSSKDTLLAGKNATDETFLQLLKQHYNIVHLSTHGYYKGDIGIHNDLKPLSSDASMSRCGVLFAGAASTLADRSFDEDLSDGVLSAAELSKLDLSSTDLIVLSACETGRGHLTSDGIYGIQRGLKMAGANSMILTLWNVNDYSSSLLMRYFYEELEKQAPKDIHTAFLLARQRLMKEEKSFYRLDEASYIYKKEVMKCNTPKHLNPFIIIDAY